jgi:hypothetical protein
MNSTDTDMLPHVLAKALWILDAYVGVDVLGVRGGDVLNTWKHVLGSFLFYRRPKFRDQVLLNLHGVCQNVTAMFASLHLPPEVIADRAISTFVAQAANEMFGNPAWLRAARFTMSYHGKDPRVMAVLHATQPIYERTIDGDTSTTRDDIIAAVRVALEGEDAWSFGGRLGRYLRDLEGGPKA